MPPSLPHRPTPHPLTRRAFVAGAGASTLGLLVHRTGVAEAATSRGVAQPPGKRSPEVAIEWTRAVYDQVKAERILPPAAARVYAYVALAGYEAIVAGMPKHRSLGGRLNGYAVPAARSGIDWDIAANEAMAVVANEVFADRSSTSREALEAHRSSTAVALAGRSPAVLVERSRSHGRSVGEHVAALARSDGYAATRGLPYVPPVGPGLWERTPPNFGAAIEPHWGQVRSFTLVRNDECRPIRPVEYSEVEGSPFWQQAATTYETVNSLTDAQRQTALFWRDNPDGTTGLPSGHWMLTACLASEQLGLDLGRTAEVLALTGLALADGFTSCWTEKYESNVLRPVTYIKAVIDPAWSSPVNSPAFPEYTSGHSVGSGAAAEVLTSLLGSFPYVDDIGVPNGFAPRTFGSFREAADEAAVSRLYGGIHYPMAISNGLDQGVAVGRKVLERALTRR